MPKPFVLCSLLTGFMLQFNTLPVWAALNQDAQASIHQEYLELKSQWTTTHTQLEQLESEKNKLESTQNLFWGYSTKGENVTWSTVYGLALPLFAPMVMSYDEQNPAWLRWTTGLQVLAGLAMLVSGFVVYQDRFGNIPYLSQFIDPQTLQSSYNLFWGSTIAYAVLGFVPSTVVAGHDGAVDLSRTSRLNEIENLTAPLKKNQAELKAILPVFEDLKANNLASALDRVALLTEDELQRAKIDSEKIKSWKLSLLDELLEAYAEAVLRENPEITLPALEKVLDSEYIIAWPEKKAELAARLPELQRAANTARLAREKREAEVAAQELAETQRTVASKYRQDLFNQAYALAVEQNFSEALEKLMEYEWQETDPEYIKVQEKKVLWFRSMLSKAYKDNYNLAANGDVKTAYQELSTLFAYWPSDHPDYNRARQKLKDWQQILDKRAELEVKRGFLTNQQISNLKALDIPVIIPAALPGQNYWYFISQTYHDSDFPTYQIVYYDQVTHKSFAMVSGNMSYCGPYSNGASSWLHSGTQAYIPNPVLGRIGLVTVEYQNAYVTQAILRHGRCYALVTPANYFYNLHDLDVPTDLERISKQDFEAVIRSLKYLN
jgi:hypothetical protein